MSEAQPYIVTDLKGSPRASESFLHLLTKVQENSQIDLDPGDSVTLTCLKDASRATLVGPLNAKLKGHRIGRKNVFLEKGRPESVERVRDVSSTLGAGPHRTSYEKKNGFVSQGKLLYPVISWQKDDEYPSYLVVLSRDGEDIDKQEVKGSEISFANLRLERGVPYTVTVTPFREVRKEEFEVGKPVRANFELASQSLVEQAETIEAQLRRDYISNPSDRTPLVLYLGFLDKNELYSDALELLGEPCFQSEADFDVTRYHLRRFLIPDSLF